MRLNWLTVDGFRNLEPRRLGFTSPTTLLYGPNAQGKTNVLEAVYMLGTTRSFRDNRPNHLVRDGGVSASIEGGVSRAGAERVLAMQLGQGGRTMRLDDKPAGLAEYASQLPVVALSGEDRALVAGVPRFRRDYLDGTSVWLRPAYLETLLDFGRCRAQRHAVLRDYAPNRGRELEAWTDVFLRLGEAIQTERAAMAARVTRVLSQLTAELSLREDVALAYAPSGGGDLRAALARCREEEQRRGMNLAGPHRDGVEILLDGRPMGAYGSSGQARTALWLLKLARVQLLAEREPEPPLFLLDDVEVELDRDRIRQLMNLTHGRTQLILTATRPLEETWGPMARVRVDSGRLLEED